MEPGLSSQAAVAACAAIRPPALLAVAKYSDATPHAQIAAVVILSTISVILSAAKNLKTQFAANAGLRPTNLSATPYSSPAKNAVNTSSDTSGGTSSRNRPRPIPSQRIQRVLPAATFLSTASAA